MVAVSAADATLITTQMKITATPQVPIVRMLRRVTEAGFREILIMIVVSRIAAILAVSYLVAAL